MCDISRSAVHKCLDPHYRARAEAFGFSRRTNLRFDYSKFRREKDLVNLDRGTVISPCGGSSVVSDGEKNCIVMRESENAVGQRARIGDFDLDTAIIRGKLVLAGYEICHHRQPKPNTVRLRVKIAG